MPASRHLRVRLTNGASLSLPVSIIPELRNAIPAQLAGIEILPGGDRLHRAEALGKQTMREFDALCLPPVRALSLPR